MPQKLVTLICLLACLHFGFPAVANTLTTGVAHPKGTEAALVNPAALVGQLSALELYGSLLHGEDSLAGTAGLALASKRAALGTVIDYELEGKTLQAVLGIGLGSEKFSFGVQALTLRPVGANPMEDHSDVGAGLRLALAKTITLAAAGYNVFGKHGGRQIRTGLAYRKAITTVELDVNYYLYNVGSKAEIIFGFAADISKYFSFGLDYSFFTGSTLSSGTPSAAFIIKISKRFVLEAMYRRGPGTFAGGFQWFL